MPSDPTIRDVAKKANVSVATVSRVINHSSAVRESTRKRVQDAIQELGYSPNPIARKLSTGQTHTIAVVLPLFTLPSFVERLRGVHQELAENDYDLVLYSVETLQKRDSYLKRLASPTTVDGVILISIPPTDEQAAHLLRSRVPTVLVDATHALIPHVIVDDEAGGKLATRHLLSLGHTRIAYLSDFLDTPFHPSMRRRFEGYCSALNEAGIPFRKEYHVWDTHGRQEARGLARRLLELEQPPTAIFAASDTQAIGVLDAAHEMGVSVPDQLSVIGFDGIRDAEYVNLTTIEQPLYESGVLGARNLLLLLNNEMDDNLLEVSLPLRLVVRGTTAAIR